MCSRDFRAVIARWLRLCFLCSPHRRRPCCCYWLTRGGRRHCDVINHAPVACGGGRPLGATAVVVAAVALRAAVGRVARWASQGRGRAGSTSISLLARNFVGEGGWEEPGMQGGNGGWWGVNGWDVRVGGKWGGKGGVQSWCEGWLHVIFLLSGTHYTNLEKYFIVRGAYKSCLRVCWHVIFHWFNWWNQRM